MLLHLILTGIREQRADAEQVPLNSNDGFIDLRNQSRCTRLSHECVELIDIAVCFDTRIILRNSAAAEEAGETFVAGLRVNLHDWKCGYIWRDARDKRHDHHRRRTDWSFRFLLCGYARRDGPDSRHSSGAWRAADRSVPREI